MKLDDLKDLNLAELSRHLQEMAPGVLETREKYQALLTEQRLYTAARELRGGGIWIGDMVRAEGVNDRDFRVEMNESGYVQLQGICRRRKQKIGLSVPLWGVGGLERID